MAGIDDRGSFYLGRRHDLSAGKTGDEPLLYDSADLTTHAVCVGMTGSGKTGLCLALLEEAALDGVPAIAIDPKGDLGNLLLTFPELRGSDFRPWIDESVATRDGISPDALADRTAEQWRKGLAHWGEDGERIRRFKDAVDCAIYTPGSSAGLSLTVLKSFNAPPAAVLEDLDAFGDQVQAAASGVLALLGVNADPVNSREHILLSKVLETAWRAGRNLTLAQIIQDIQNPPFNMVGAVPVGNFLASKDRDALAMKLNNLLASPSFASWLQGEPLDVQRLLYTSEGKPRLSILSIAHLGEQERMFFVTLLLNELISWMRSQPGTSSLRAILYMDEVFGYFPPTANPPAKRPMLTLLKQARAYGVGCVLATQNPVDLDYKGLSNAGTWFLGRLQTERDKARVLEGLEGASAEAGATFDRGKMEQALAALGKRVFLMNNVHDAAPTVFESRWALSYLAGPLTRGQIGKLMAERKAATAVTNGVETASERPASKAAAPASPVSAAASRPLLSGDVPQKFWPVDGGGAGDGPITYRPALLGLGKVKSGQTSGESGNWQPLAALQPVKGALSQSPWDGAIVTNVKPTLGDEPVAGAAFDDLPGPLGQEKTYGPLKRELGEWLCQTQRSVKWKCDKLGETSRDDETEAAFRDRIAKLAVVQRDVEKARVRQKYSSRLKTQEEQVERAEVRVANEKTRFWTRLLNMLWRIAEVVLAQLGGRRSRKQIVTATSASQTIQSGRQQSAATSQLDRARQRLEELTQEQENELAAIDVKLDAGTIAITKVEVPFRKSDVDVDEVLLVWLPYRTASDGRATQAYALPKSAATNA